jgi:hypothetical protein
MDKYPYTKEAQTICNILEDYLEDMEPHESDFLLGLMDRFDKWGDETRISEKQISWLRGLERKYT